METIMQPGKRALRQICVLGRVAGWATIAMGAFGLWSLAAASRGLGPVPRWPKLVFDFFAQADDIFLGLIVLGTVQFIRYSTAEDTEVPWLLRYAHFILYFYALLLLVRTTAGFFPGLRLQVERFLYYPEDHVGGFLGLIILTVVSLISIIAKPLCLVALGAILRTVLPILGESKTLA